jgi:large subunit ribosomal protein L23
VNQERIYELVRRPHISEKTTLAGDQSNQVVFEVKRDASKPEIRRAVEELFKVKVTGVNTLNVPGKRTRFGGRPGSRPGWKKAYVRLAAGEELDFLGGE